MKTTIFYFIAAVGIVLIACNKHDMLYDTDETVMVDVTDSLTVHPTATVLLEPFKLKENPWQGIRIKVVTVADNELSNLEFIALEKEDRLTGNKTMRQAKVRRFIEQLETYLAPLNRSQHLTHSIIYRSIAKEAGLLAMSPSKTKLLIVCSDLLENSEVDFYKPQTIEQLRKNPAAIEKQLEANQPLPSLTGLQVWFLYAPDSYRQNSVFMPIARFYETVYTQHQATVHIANQFSMQ